MSVGPFTQEELDAFTASLSPLALLKASVADYWLPLLVGFVGTLSADRFRRLARWAHTLRHVALGIWALWFASGLLGIDTATRGIEVARYGLYSMLALVPLLAISCLGSSVGRKSIKGWRFGSLVAVGTIASDWTFLAFCMIPLPPVLP